MKTDNRTTQQNNAYWQFQTWIADEMSDQWITLDKLVIEIQPKATKNSLHEVFKAIWVSMYQKESTTQLTREEMQNILDVYMIALAKTWVHIEFPDRSVQSLLNNF